MSKPLKLISVILCTAALSAPTASVRAFDLPTAQELGAQFDGEKSKPATPPSFDPRAPYSPGERIYNNRRNPLVQANIYRQKGWDFVVAVWASNEHSKTGQRTLGVQPEMTRTLHVAPFIHSLQFTPKDTTLTFLANGQRYKVTNLLEPNGEYLTTSKFSLMAWAMDWLHDLPEASLRHLRKWGRFVR